MSDAERPGRVRERLDWSDAEATRESEPVDDSEPAGEVDTAETASDSASGGAKEGDLCVIEDPTCEACQ